MKKIYTICTLIMVCSVQAAIAQCNISYSNSAIQCATSDPSQVTYISYFALQNFSTPCIVKNVDGFLSSYSGAQLETTINPNSTTSIGVKWLTPGSHYIEYKCPCESTNRNQTVIVQSPTVSAGSIESQSICNGASTTLTANGVDGTIFRWEKKLPADSWSSPTVISHTTNVLPSQYIDNTTTYDYRIVVGNNCAPTAYAYATVTVTTVAVPSIATPSNTCDQAILVKSGSPADGATWYWQGINSLGVDTSPSANASTNNYTANFTATYYLGANIGACWSYSSIAITIKPRPQAPPSSFTILGSTCGSKSIDFTGTNSSEGTYFWQGQIQDGYSIGSTSDQNYTADISGPYYLRTLGNNGCWSTNSASTVVTVNPYPATPPTPVATTNDCDTKTLSVSGTPPSGVTWYWQGLNSSGTNSETSSNASTNNFPAVNSGTYYLGAYNGTCWTYSSLAVTVKPLPQAPPSTFVVGSNTCGARTIDYTGSAPGSGDNYYWQGLNQNGTSIGSNAMQYDYSADQSGSNPYYLRTLGSNGCWSANSASIVVSVNHYPAAPPSPVATTNDCDTKTLSVSGTPPGGVTWYWQGLNSSGTSTTPSANASSNNYPATSSGTYYLGAYNGACWTYSSLAVTVKPLPQAPPSTFVVGSNTCGARNIDYTGSAPGSGDNYYWQGLNQNGTSIGSNAMQYDYSADQLGSNAYYLRTLGSNGCWSTNSASVVVVVNFYPSAPPVPVATTNDCDTKTLSVSGTPPGGVTWYWQGLNSSGINDTPSANASTNNYSATSSGTYYLGAYNGTCWTYSSLAVTVKQLPQAPPSSFVVGSNTCGARNIDYTGSAPNAGDYYYWQGLNQNGTTIGSDAMQADYSATTSGSNPYYLRTLGSNGCWSTNSASAIVNVKLIPVLPDVSGTVRLGPGTFSLSASVPQGSIPAVTDFIWNTPVGVFNGSQYTTVELSQSTSNYLNVKSVADGCESSPKSVNLDVLPSPVVSFVGQGYIPIGGSATLTTGTYNTYAWKDASSTVIGNAQNVTISNPGSYTVNVTLAGIPGTGISLPIVVGDNVSAQNLNYVVESSILIEGVVNDQNVSLLNIGDRSQVINYFDGLGRTIQSINAQGSPSKKDIIQPSVYDAFGRESFKYLPISAENNGRFKDNIIDPVTNAYSGIAQPFYSLGSDNKIADDQRPYAETIFDQSPLNRPVRQYGPGQAWAPAPSGSDKFIQHQYLANVHGTVAGEEKIVVWKIDGSGMPVREAPLENYIQTGGYYNSNQLAVESSKDEQGNEIREYSDKTGKVVLKKVQAVLNPVLSNRDHWTQTYFVYDYFGNLRYVLQPELSKKVHQDDSYIPSSADLNNLAFQYKYDSRNRMIEKIVPGAAVVYMVYDNRDRLVLTQDGNQRNSDPKYWAFMKYDDLKRPILTGIKDTSVALTQAQMQNIVNAHYNKSWAKWSETYIGNVAGNVHGYSNKSYPVVNKSNVLDIDQYLTVTYYDNYIFRNLWNASFAYLNEGLSAQSNGKTYSQPVTESLSTTGQVTGIKVKVLDGSVTGGSIWLQTAVYYDENYRVIQTISDNVAGGKDRITNVFDFVGKIFKTKTSHYISWKDRANIAVTGDKLIKTGPSGWNSGAASQHQLAAGQDGWMEFTASETTTARAIGLSDANINNQHTSIDYCFAFPLGGTYRIYENGVLRLTNQAITIGDLLKIERTGTTIKYYKNGAVVYTSTIPSTTNLLVDAAFNTQGGTITGIKTSFGSDVRTVARRFEYDHAGRLLKTFHSIDNAPEVVLAQNQYNELGQLVDKSLHSANNGATFKQSVDHRYNIRGWLTSINNSQLAIADDNDDSNDFFGMQLGYNDDLGTGNAQLFNGNISAIKWSANLGLANVKERAYNYSYDQLSRITGATFVERASTWTTPAGSSFSESGYSYDLNGNILGLTRKGKNGTDLDILSYYYLPGTNKLDYIIDLGDKYQGFKNISSGNYTYDANGNVAMDNYKDFNIKYNFLNLPEKLTQTWSNTINLNYIYDGSGRKLSQLTTFSGATKSIDYIGNFQYENGALQFITHEEGSVVLSASKAIYNNNCESLTGVSATNSTLELVTLNGNEKYIKVTSIGSVTGSGISSIGSTFTVQPGERYRVRAKGYRGGSSNVYILIQAPSNVNWPGAGLPKNAKSEAWIEQEVVIPVGVTSMIAGITWNMVSTGEQFFLNEFEIVKITTQEPEYQYNLRDHLGNVRLTFTSKDETDTGLATLETGNAAAEQSKFLYYDEAIKVNYDLFDHTNAGTTFYSTRLLGGSTNAVYGLAKSLSVMPGDVINMEVYAKYLDPESSNWNAALTNFMAAVAGGTAPPGTVVDGGSSGSIGGGTFPYGGTFNHGSEGGPAPKAYLNFIVFDRDFNPILSESGFIRISTAAKENGSDVAHEKLTRAPLTIKQPGYVYIYLSNENETSIEVYFDDFKVEHIKSPVIATQDYYPFGLTFNSYQRENSVPNKFLFQGKELQNDLGLDVYDFEWRQYDPATGRTTTQDPHADSYWDLSPYSFLANNPINVLDPTGMDTTKVKDLDMKTFDPENDVVELDEIVITPGDEEEEESGSTSEASSGSTTEKSNSGSKPEAKPNSDAGANRIAIADKYLGLYTYKQGRAGDGLFLEDKHLDCSEFVLRVLKESDPEIYKKLTTTDKNGYFYGNTATMQTQIKAKGGTFRKTKPKVGDLIMWGGHVEFIRTVKGEYFTTIGAGGGTGKIVPRIMGMDRKRGTFNWLHTSHADIGTLGDGGYLGIWSPK